MKITTVDAAQTTLRIVDALRSVLVLGQDGTVKYKQGWTDARVAQENGVTLGAVTRLRQEQFGRTRRRPGEGETSLLQRVADLEERLRYLEHSLGVGDDHV